MFAQRERESTFGYEVMAYSGQGLIPWLINRPRGRDPGFPSWMMGEVLLLFHHSVRGAEFSYQGWLAQGSRNICKPRQIKFAAIGATRMTDEEGVSPPVLGPF
uniref:Uncharacterized protein n=1 Tax=Candidatus Kentrum sp. UNK TaxID=2126344 RepID=A0A451B3A5_9GAMM|nr:MAG: hypothetical protein BECKUNK1418G_GA0071005_114711 [Candidatus Kentron sp. UNK]VFK72752.1 MAG: hypothetical protein BECKUNK1418H_GA0071006_113611 [Candidatus Kentron sp. UNK]